MGEAGKFKPFIQSVNRTSKKARDANIRRDMRPAVVKHGKSAP